MHQYPQSPAKWGRILAAQQRSGLSRRKLYYIAEQHVGLFRKAGSATLVNLQFLDEILGALPPASIGAVELTSTTTTTTVTDDSKGAPVGSAVRRRNPARRARRPS